jgi:hypothetical protein
MTTFSAAVAAALDRPDDGVKPGIYSHVAEPEFNVKKNGQFAPSIVVQLLAKLILDDADIVFIDGTRQRITVNDLPTSKAAFDDVFCTTTAAGKLSCKFVIQSEQSSFHAIKIRVWDILQKHQIWFKRAPGPFKKTPLVAIGFWLNLHPGFASPRVFHTQIMQDIENQYARNTEVIRELRLPTEYVPIEMYFCHRKINATYSVNGKSQNIDTEAFMTYAPKETAALALLYLTKLSSLRVATTPADPIYIPLAAKYNSPEKFGQYVAGHNEFLNNHRNIAIVGIIPDAMDANTVTGANLWTSIKALPGVYRCDPCRRTHDLGKWNISCSADSHTAICEWIDKNMVNIWNSIPTQATLPKIGPFPIPERLSKGRRVSSGSSVASGLTDASPIDDYLKQLECNLPSTALPAQGTRNVWNRNRPVEDLQYSFNTTEFPQLLTLDKTSKSTATTAQESISVVTSPVTAVSAITEGLVSHTVKSSITEFENRRKAADAAFELRMAKLEMKVGSIHQQVDDLTDRMTAVIVKTLTADNGIIAQQHALIVNQDKKINRMETAVDQLASSIQDLLKRDRARDLPMTHDHSIDSPPQLGSPDRNRKVHRTEANDGDDEEHPTQDSPMFDPLPSLPNPCQQ